MQITQVLRAESQFPDRLQHVKPTVGQLSIRGTLPEQHRPHVAVIGARQHTAYGEDQAYRFAGALARLGVVIVSGLALGIDAVAHRAAVEVSGTTIAVLASGVDQISPASNRGLADEILRTGGAIVSEYDPGTHADKYRFPDRNRIIAGLSDAVLIVEADAKSGTLITAQHAHNAGRSVLAIPGSLSMQMSRGPNNLIRSGSARLVTDIADVLDEIGIEVGPKVSEGLPATESREEGTVLRLIHAGTNQTDSIVIASGLSAATVAATLTALELTGRIRNIGGGIWSVRLGPARP